MNGSIVLQIQSKGALKLLVVQCNAQFGIRATAKWQGDVTDDAGLFSLINDGQFVITLDPKMEGSQADKNTKNQIYQGIVPLEGDSISEVLENYMLRSEQIDTRIWLCCNGDAASGLLIQKLPDTMNQTTRGHEQQAQDFDTWNRVQHLASTITDAELLSLPAKTILVRLFNQEDVRLFDASQTQFFCSCSRDSVANMLRMLGADEINSILAEQGQIAVNCDFCNTHYPFDKVDSAALLLNDTVLPANGGVH
jgi:molecular chaperone Hsp33